MIRFGKICYADREWNVKVEPVVEFQYGVSLFPEIGNSNISAADWIILAKFGMQIALGGLKSDPSKKIKKRKYICDAVGTIFKERNYFTAIIINETLAWMYDPICSVKQSQ